MDIQGNVIPGTGISQCKGPEGYICSCVQATGGQWGRSGVSSGEGNWRKSSEKPLELGLYSNKVTIEAYFCTVYNLPFSTE